MEGNCSNNGDQEGKARTASAEEDVAHDQQLPGPNGSTVTFDEGNGSKAKEPKGKEIVDASALDAQENTPVHDPGVDDVIAPNSENVSITPSVDASVPEVDGGHKDKMLSEDDSTFQCRYCEKHYPSSQALGGHQNSHKQERQLDKRPRRQNAKLMNPPIYPKYNNNNNNSSSSSNNNNNKNNPSFNISASLGLAQLPLPNVNLFNLQWPSPGYHVSSNTLYPGFNPFLNLGQFGQPSSMWFNNMRLSAYESRMMNCPKNNGNKNYTVGGHMNSNFGIVGGPGGGKLGGFQAPNSNSNFMGSDFNSLGIVGGQGSGSTTLGALLQNGNSYSSAYSFKTAGNTSGEARSLSGFSDRERNVYFEFQDIIRGNNHEGDGTIDLLSRVGMGSTGEDEEMNGDHGNDDTELRL